MNKDVIIVGGGVIGCSIALNLANAGLSVAVIERGRVGCEASRAAAGMLAAQSETSSVGPFFDLCLRSRSMYRDFAAHLKEVSGIDVEYNDDGLLCVTMESEDTEESMQWVSWQTEAGLALEQLTQRAIREFEPAVAESVSGGVFIPGDHQVENRRLMDALEIAIRRAGVQLIEGTEVSALATAGSSVIGVVAGGQRWDAGTVVVAAGAWTSRLLKPLGVNVKVEPARGQMIAVKGRGCPIKRVLHSRKVYLVPRHDGRILIGATVEYTGFEKAVTANGISSLLSAALEVVPSLRDFELTEVWSGLRPDTADHLPVIGRGVDGLVLATGHFRSGILLAPVTAELITDLVTTGRESDALSAFSTARFEVPSAPSSGERRPTRDSA